MRLVTPPKYFKYPECQAGDVLVNEGKYLETKEGKYGPQHYFEEESGEKICLNSAGQLNFLIGDNLWKGRKCKIVYKGKVELTKGPMSGKEAHNFDLFLDDSAPKVENVEPTSSTTDLSSLE